jgi:hypothetical protein
MSKHEHPRELKNYLINSAFQLKLLGYFAVMYIITTLCLYSTVYLFFWRFKEKALKVGIPEGHVFFDFLTYQKTDMDQLFLGLAALNFFVLLAAGLILSHRIAGPIHKLKIHLRLEAPASEPFTLRENDFFRELEPIMKDLKEKL